MSVRRLTQHIVLHKIEQYDWPRQLRAGGHSQLLIRASLNHRSQDPGSILDVK